MRHFPKGFGGQRRDAEQLRRDGWRDLGILAVAEDDPRLNWPERELVRHLGAKLYGPRSLAKEAGHG